MTKTKTKKVEEFKQFVKRHPDLIKEVRKGNTTWQKLYEEWYLLGEDDPSWRKYKRESSKQSANNKTENESDEKTGSELFMQIINYVKKLDMDQVQQHIEQLNTAIESLQQFLTEMNKNQSEKDGMNNMRGRRRGPRNPFAFRKD